MIRPYNAVIFGGGIMGLLAAYEIVKSGGHVLIIEKDVIGNKHAGSSGTTRSLRSDYSCPAYASLARQSWKKWQTLAEGLQQTLIVRTGCLNLSVSANVEDSYAMQANQWLQRDSQNPEIFAGSTQLTRRFPQFKNISYAVLEQEAGIGYPKVTIHALTTWLETCKECDIQQDCTTLKLQITNGVCKIVTNKGTFESEKVILAAGLGTPELLTKIDSNSYRLSLTADRPQESAYFIPDNSLSYEVASLPIFACLDKGIYGHPIIKGVTKGVKIGRYKPPQTVNQNFTNTQDSVSSFIETYMPALAQSKIEPVIHEDQCSYDMTIDGGFVVGQVPDCPQVFVAAGFCGTGYKFAPVISEVICDFTMDKTIRHDISAFNPLRFTV